MKISLTPNSQQNPQFGMFKATPEAAEKLNKLFKLGFHSNETVFKLNKEWMSELCYESQASKIDEFIQKHPNTYVTQNDYWEIAGSADSLAKAEKLAANAENLKPEAEKAIETHSTIIEDIKTQLSTARTNAYNELEKLGLNLMG